MIASLIHIMITIMICIMLEVRGHAGQGPAQLTSYTPAKGRMTPSATKVIMIPAHVMIAAEATGR